MDETNAGGGPPLSDLTHYIVRVGFDGSTVAVRFTGRELCEASNHSYEGPNRDRWHNWTLYEVGKGYRVYDVYHTQWRGEAGHSKLSKVLGVKGLATAFPALMHAALEAGVFSEEAVALDADAGEADALEVE